MLQRWVHIEMQMTTATNCGERVCCVLVLGVTLGAGIARLGGRDALPLVYEACPVGKCQAVGTALEAG
jgi:hypothetical protein